MRRMLFQIAPAVIGLLLSPAAALSVPFLQQVLANDICPLPEKVAGPKDGLFLSINYVKDERILHRQADRLSKAVQVPTTVTDSVLDPFDDAFSSFVEFQDLLESLFPLTHSLTRIDHINRLGLVITLNGTAPSLKPLLFTAHQDVVPINDPADWTHPPFAGHFDGEWVWGRGASDCKNVLIGLLSVVEDLLHQNWQPTRTVVLAFGFDEESRGFLGAGSIAAFLEEKYGPDSFEFILDEGGMGLVTLGPSPDPTSEEHRGEGEGVVYALPGVGEKGALDLVLSLSVRGGHSSVPPPHTGIGIMSEIIYELERNDLFTPYLGHEHPSRRMLECQAQHSPDDVEPWLASALQSDDYEGLAEAVAASRGDKVRFTFQTSQAADLFSGGVKSNALPEKISALVNYRVALHQTPELVQERALRIITPILKKNNVTWTPFPGSDESVSPREDEEASFGHLVFSTLSPPLSPAPVSPTDIETNAVWARFAGVTRSVFESVPSLRGKTVVVSGDIMTGNTDTKFYWNLSRNIYRWSPSRVGRALNIHTVDERMGIDAHLEAMMLYYDLIRAFDKWEDSAPYIRDL